MTVQSAVAVSPVTTQALSTATILCGLAVSSASLPVETASNIFAFAALGVGLTLGVGTCIEGMSGIRTLIRVDILILWVLYGLTFFEFLFQQPRIDAVVSPEAATSGTNAVLVGFAGLVIGRHLIPIRERFVRAVAHVNLQSTDIFVLFVLATLLGYLHILLAVNFDPFEMLRQMALPRFAQSWSRGAYGDAYSLLYELGMLISLIPPISGLIYARAQEFNFVQKLVVTAVLALTLWYGFASGTRNVLATYLITLVGAYLLVKPGISTLQAILVGVLSFVVLFVASTYMLEFRKIGIGNYSFADSQFEGVFIDHNIVNVSRLTTVFPIEYEFLGFEIPYNALVRPVPRVLWPDKPEGLSISIEQALGARGSVTLSCTFVGEAYMAGGLIGVLIFGLMLGAAAALWNRVGEDLSSPIRQLIYVSGFVCASIAMRSMLSMVPLMLPTLALWIYGRVWGGVAPGVRRAPPPKAL